jgi:hypothetical protein
MLDINSIAYQLPIEANTDLLCAEVEQFILNERPEYRGPKIDWANSFSVTNLKVIPKDLWFRAHNGPMKSLIDPATGENISKDYTRYTLGYPGTWRDNLMAYYKNGTADKDLVHWRDDMQDTEMYRLGQRIKEFFKLDYNLRCRVSMHWGEAQVTRHSDPHTPWRVHITLKTGPKSHWGFYDPDNFNSDECLIWEQPPGSVWLVRTGNIQHQVYVPRGEYRLQLFYHIWNKDLGPNYHQIA